MGAKSISLRMIPADIEAVQWDGTLEHATELIEWVRVVGEIGSTLRYLCEPGECKHDKGGRNSHYLMLNDMPDLADVRIYPNDWLAINGIGSLLRIPGELIWDMCERPDQCAEVMSTASKLEEPERCTEFAMHGDTVCEHHLDDQSDYHESLREESRA